MSDPYDDDLVGKYEEEDVGLRPEDKKHARSNEQEWFKGEKGVSYRVAFVYFWPLAISLASAAKAQAKEKGVTITKEQLHEIAKKALTKRAEELGKAVDQLEPHEKLDMSEARFKKIPFHYKEGVGYVMSRLGKDGADADEVWKMLGEQKVSFTTTLLIYPTDRKGELDRENMAKHFKVLPWRLSSKVYQQLHGQASSLRNNDLSIADQDLVITCTNSDYQNFDKMEGAGKALYRKNPKFQSIVLAKAFPYYEKLLPFRELSTADLRIKLGLTSDNKGEDVSADDVEDLLKNV